MPERLRGTIDHMLQPDPKRRPGDLSAVLHSLAPIARATPRGFWRSLFGRGRAGARP